MTHTFTGGREGRSYRYYRCTGAIKSGAATCSSGAVPALEIERVVVDEIRALAGDKDLLDSVLAEAQAAVAADLEALRVERDGLRDELARHHRALRALAAKGDATPDRAARIADLNERIACAERRLPQVDARVEELGREAIGRAEAEAAFREFDALWQHLSPREQARVLRLLVSNVDFDAEEGTVSVTFRPTSIRAFMSGRKDAAA
jgi:site-specific DNA recombinase